MHEILEKEIHRRPGGVCRGRHHRPAGDAAVGLAIAVANAREESKDESHVITDHRGGDGAVRDAVEFILKAKEGTKSRSGVHQAENPPSRNSRKFSPWQGKKIPPVTLNRRVTVSPEQRVRFQEALCN